MTETKYRIALIGPPGTGKTTIGDHFLSLRPEPRGVRLSFADALKTEVHNSLDFVPKTPEEKETVRPVYQAWGMFRRLHNGEDYWVKYVEMYIEMMAHFDQVVDDCRFPNEYELLKQKQYKFVRLEAGGTTIAVADHESERHWPSFEADLVLDYIKGPRLQAERIIYWLEGGADDNAGD